MAIVIVNRDCKSTRIYNGHTIDFQIKKISFPGSSSRSLRRRGDVV